MRLNLTVFVIGVLFAFPNFSASEEKGNVRVTPQNTMAKKILQNTHMSEHGNAWVITDVEHGDSSSFVISTLSVTNNAVRDSGTPALLVISCLNHDAGVSILYDGKQEILPPIVELAAKFNPDNEETYYGTPLAGYDSVGVFRSAATYFVRDMITEEKVTITLPHAQLDWDFDIKGLDAELMKFKDACAFVNWKQWDVPLLRMLLLELYRKSTEDDSLQDDIDFVYQLLDRGSSEPHQDMPDHERVQKILKKVKR